MTRPRVFWPCAIVSVAAFSLFGALAVQINGDNGLTQYDTQLAQAVREHANESPALKLLFTGISAVGSEWLLAPLGLAVAVLLWRRREHALAVLWVVVLGGSPVLNKLIKHSFHRLRPFVPPDDHDWSFPSGHSMNSFVYYGLLTYVLLLLIPRRWVKFAAAVALGCLVVLIGFSRIYLSRHYLSDVAGGFAFGAGWIAAWIAVLEYLRQPHGPQPVGLAEVKDKA